MENKLAFFTLNVIAIAVPIAFLEIITEKDMGWGAGHPKDKWYGKIIGENYPLIKFLAKSVGVPYFFGYAVFMYFVLIPLLLLGEYFLLIPNASLLIAIYFASVALEDFLWFVFNWHFDSLRQLFKGPLGSIWWHKRWLKIGKQTYLPASYLTAAIFTTIFYFLS